MEIICPTCNKSYNIPVERLPKKRASAKCKNCGQTMQIESSGVARPQTPVTSPVAFADGKSKSSAGHAILLDYPELQRSRRIGWPLMRSFLPTRREVTELAETS